MKRMWSKDELGGSIYQHLITIKDGNEDFTGTFLLFSSSATPISTAMAIPTGIVLQGLGEVLINGESTSSSYVIRNSNKITFKGILIDNGEYKETEQAVNLNYDFIVSDVVTKI